MNMSFQITADIFGYILQLWQKATSTLMELYQMKVPSFCVLCSLSLSIKIYNKWIQYNNDMYNAPHFCQFYFFSESITFFFMICQKMDSLKTLVFSCVCAKHSLTVLYFVKFKCYFLTSLNSDGNDLLEAQKLNFTRKYYLCPELCMQQQKCISGHIHLIAITLSYKKGQRKKPNRN